MSREQAFPNIKYPKRFFNNLNGESLIKLTNASSLEQNMLLPEHKEKQHYCTTWMALLKSVEWMGFY
jgi:hypothetical protein